MFTCWKISTLWLVLWVSCCQPASWTLSNTGTEILQPSEKWTWQGSSGSELLSQWPSLQANSQSGHNRNKCERQKWRIWEIYREIYLSGFLPCLKDVKLKWDAEPLSWVKVTGTACGNCAPSTGSWTTDSVQAAAPGALAHIWGVQQTREMSD